MFPMIEYLNVITSGLVLLITVGYILRKEYLDWSHLTKITGGIEKLKNVLDFIGDLPRWIYLYENLNANVRILQGKRDRLQKRLRDLREEVEEEEYRTSRQRKKEVDFWLNSAETKCVEVLMLLQRMARETNYIWKFIYLAWLSNQVERSIQEVDDLYNAGGFEEVLSSVSNKLVLFTTPLVGNAAEGNIGKIMEWLNDGVTKIGVHGIKGIGKTSVVMHIHNRLSGSGKYVYFITVLEHHKGYNLQSEIAKAVGIDLQEEAGIKRAALLYQALQQRKFVLILDGLSNYFLEEKVGIPLGAETGKLIITSRSLDVCRKTGCRNNIIAMDPLPPDEAWILFKEKAELAVEHGSHIEIVARKIVEQCRGVPHKIVEKARCLRGEDDINVWEEKSQ